MATKTRLTLRPGQNGTKHLQRKYGDWLPAVRYLYDATRQRRIKTVELVEEELPWTEPLPSGAAGEQPVLLRIAFDERVLRGSIKRAGGQWDQGRKLWRLSLGQAVALGLRGRVVGDV